MKTDKTSLAAGEGAEPPPLSGPSNQDRDGKQLARISSRKPDMTTGLATLIAAICFGAAAKQLLASNQAPWMLLSMGIGHLFIALAGFVMWKRVQSGAGHYVISDFVKSERIPFENVCMVVQSHGLIWESIRIHFRRPTRFGRSVAYVPVVPAARSGTLVAKSEASAQQCGNR